MKSPRFLEYIESDGRQYIDTAVDLYGDKTVQMSAKITQPDAGVATLFGTRKGGSYRFTAAYASGSSGTLRIEFTPGEDWGTRYRTWDTGLKKDAEITGMVHVSLQGENIYADGFPAIAQFFCMEGLEQKGGVQKFKTGTTFVFPASLYLFACHDYDAGAVDFASMQIRSCSITGVVRATKEGESGVYYLKEVPVRDFYPAKDENGRVCLYDAISDSYFYSKTETDFIAGPEINRMLFRAWSHEPQYTPQNFLKAVETVPLPREAYYATAPFNHPTDPDGDLYEFVGYDTAPEAFTAVYPTRDYGQGVPLDLSHKNHVYDVYAVWKYLYGYLVKDGNGSFYTKNDDGTRRSLGEQTLCAQLFRDYSFRGYPGSDMLADLPSPSIFNWTKKGWEDDEHVWHYYAPATFDATLKGVPPLPQLVTFPTVTLRKTLAYITIPAEPDTTLWNVSFDGGGTWYKYEGAWIQVTEEGDGCHKRRLELLDKDDWSAALANNTVRLRAWMRKDAWVAAIRLEYLEED